MSVLGKQNNRKYTHIKVVLGLSNLFKCHSCSPNGQTGISLFKDIQRMPVFTGMTGILILKSRSDEYINR
ncbi:MAG: hypothetical protein JSW07_10285 [bacterium]|nr:MAG: hypothetical protein JSW07_10285 [bacterium]